MTAGEQPAERDSSGSEPFRVDVIRERTTVRVVPVGELDLSSAGQLRAHLDELVGSGSACLVLDLRQVRFMDSTGLALIIETNRACREHSCELSIIQGPRQVRQLFELTGLLDQLPFVA